MSCFVIKLPNATPSLNTLMGWKHHERTRNWKYAQYKAQVREELEAAFGHHEFTKPTKRMRVTFTRFSAGELDDDNLRGGFKPMRDALKDLNVIVDDNSRWLEAHYFQVKTPTGVQGTTIEIEVLP
jgi:hypothetical protein